jgi:DNA-binding protein H-NS
MSLLSIVVILMGKNMHGVDLKALSFEDLEDLKRDVDASITARRDELREEAAQEMRRIAERLGMSAEEVLGVGGGRRAGKRAKAAAKYRNPEDSSQVWAGRGRKPAWVVAALKAGKTIEDLEI